MDYYINREDGSIKNTTGSKVEKPFFTIMGIEEFKKRSDLPYYKDLRVVNLLNDDETQEIIKIVWATGYCGGGMRGARRGREGEGGRVGCGVRGARRLELCPRPQGVRA